MALTRKPERVFSHMFSQRPCLSVVKSRTPRGRPSRIPARVEIVTMRRVSPVACMSILVMALNYGFERRLM